MSNNHPEFTGFVHVGNFGVDAGLVWIGDPCYVLHQEEPPAEIGNNWSEFCDKLEGEVTSFNFGHGHEGLGLAISTYMGDGEYPVFVEYENGRPRRILIDFDPPDDNDEAY